MNIDEFLTCKYMRSSYIDYDGFSSLYVRKTDVFVRIDCESYFCRNVFTIASVQAYNPGSGAFKSLIKYLVYIGKSIYVELVHTEWFRDKLIEWGFKRVNVDSGYHYIFNYDFNLDKA